MQTNDCPLSGWKGCVTRTRRLEITEEAAFCVEVQALVHWPFSLLAGEPSRDIQDPGGTRTAGIVLVAAEKWAILADRTGPGRRCNVAMNGTHGTCEQVHFHGAPDYLSVLAY